jgi:hypothetical protein
MRCALLVLSVLPFIAGCNSVDTGYGYSRPYVPFVALPTNLDPAERNLLPEIEDVLNNAGYRTSFSGEAEYDLDFLVDSGPINTDVRIRLFRGRQEIVVAYARSGGARSLFRRGQVVRDAFEKCLREFEARLPRSDHRRTGPDPWRDDRYLREGGSYDERDDSIRNRGYEDDRTGAGGTDQP